MTQEAIIHFRRNTAAPAASSNPVLDEGEPGIETDTGKFKIGDGVTAWNDLKYVNQEEITYLKTLQEYQPLWDVADTTSITGFAGDRKWLGACLAPNGKIYCVPYNSESVLITSPGFPTLPIAPLLSPYLNKF
jgi:hypothetical protein